MAHKPTAGKVMRKKWYQFWADHDLKMDENADPKVLMHMTISQARQDMENLKAAAAQVLGNVRRVEMQLNRAANDREALQRQVQAALKVQAAESNPAKRAEYEGAARDLFNELQRKDAEIETLTVSHQQAQQAANQAEQAVKDRSRELEQALSEQHALLAANAQAEMQEEMNSALQTLHGAIGDGITPTFGEVRERIEERMANAMGAAQLQGLDARNTRNRIADAALELEADSALDAMRREMGLLPSTEPVPAIEVTSTEVPTHTPPAAATASQPTPPTQGNSGGNKVGEFKGL